LFYPALLAAELTPGYPYFAVPQLKIKAMVLRQQRRRSQGF
jgi:hypothetical protein